MTVNLCADAHAQRGDGWSTPVDELVRETKNTLRKHTKDPEGYYRLGRIHHFALRYRSDSLRTDSSLFGRRYPLVADENPINPWMQAALGAASPSTDVLTEHLREA